MDKHMQAVCPFSENIIGAAPYDYAVSLFRQILNDISLHLSQIIPNGIARRVSPDKGITKISPAWCVFPMRLNVLPQKP